MLVLALSRPRNRAGLRVRKDLDCRRGIEPSEAERIESSRTLRGTDEEDTTPDVFRTGQAPLT